jgi:H+-transporting ATPase
MGGVYYLLQDSVGFDNLMHGKNPKKSQKQRSLEDFGKLHSPIPHLISNTNIVCSRFITTCINTAREERIDAFAITKTQSNLMSFPRAHKGLECAISAVVG